jgi:GLPGLI family protein
MKTILTIYGGLMLSITAYAQQSYPTLIKVQYNFIHVRDTTQRGKPYTETMLLVAGKDASYYTSFDRIEQTTNMALTMIKNRKTGIQGQFPTGKPNSQTNYYTFAKEHKFINYEQMGINYLVEGDIEIINWKILKDTSNFSGIHAQKATATYKGRNWIAWFAPELPFANGPWKLGALPGLIVEAYDDKNDVQFKFGGIEKVKPGDLAVDKAREEPDLSIKNINGLDVSQITVMAEGPVSNGGPVKITKKEYDKLKVFQDKDPVGFMTAQFATIGIKDPAAMAQRVASGNGGGGSGGGGGNNGGPQVQPDVKRPAPIKNEINNPIERP